MWFSAVAMLIDALVLPHFFASRCYDCADTIVSLLYQLPALFLMLGGACARDRSPEAARARPVGALTSLMPAVSQKQPPHAYVGACSYHARRVQPSAWSIIT